MPMLPADDYQPNERLRSLGVDAYPSTFGDAVGASFEEAWTRNPTTSLLRELQRQQRELDPEMDRVRAVRGDVRRRRGDDAGMLADTPNMEPAAPGPAMLDPEAANRQYGIDGELKFDRDTPEQTARDLYDLKREELRRRNIMSRAQGGFAEGAASFGAGLAASVADPLNIASAFIPVVGAARYALWAQRLGTTGARVARGAVEGLVGAAILEPAVYGVARSEQADYDATDSLLNLAFGTVLGGGLHAGLGKIGDVIQQRRMAEPLLRDSVAAVVEDRPVDVSPMTDGLAPEARLQELDEFVASAAERQAAYIARERERYGRMAAGETLPEQADLPGTMRVTPEEARERLAELDEMERRIAEDFSPEALRQTFEAKNPLETSPEATAARKALSDIRDLARRKETEGLRTFEKDDPHRRLARAADKYFDELPADTRDFLLGRPARDFETGETHRIGVESEIGGGGAMNVHGAHIFDLEELVHLEAVDPPATANRQFRETRLRIDSLAIRPDEAPAVAAVDALVGRTPTAKAPRAEGAAPLGPKAAEAQAELDSVMQQIEAMMPLERAPDAAAEPAPAAAAQPPAPRKMATRTDLFLPVPKEPLRLVSWIVKQGGIKDQGKTSRGEISHLIGSKGKTRPGIINNKSGANLDDLALRAWEEGYFSDLTERPDVDTLLAAISDDFTGTPRYAEKDRVQVEDRDMALAANEEIERLANTFDIDTTGLSRAEFFDRLAETQSFDDLAAERVRIDEAAAAAYDDAVRLRQEEMAARGDAWEPEILYSMGAPRTLADLEAENAAIRAAGDTGPDGQGPGGPEDGTAGPDGVSEGGGAGADIAGRGEGAGAPGPQGEAGRLNQPDVPELRAADEGVIRAESDAKAYERAAFCLGRNT